jgi:transposase
LEQVNHHHDLKAEWAGKRVELVNPRNKSQICSGYSQIVKKELSERNIVVLSVVLF